MMTSDLQGVSPYMFVRFAVSRVSFFALHEKYYCDFFFHFFCFLK